MAIRPRNREERDAALFNELARKAERAPGLAECARWRAKNARYVAQTGVPGAAERAKRAEADAQRYDEQADTYYGMLRRYFGVG